MIFSVPTDSGYVYYEAPGKFPATGRVRPPRGAPIGGMFAPESFTARVPTGAKRTGTGIQARGVLATLGGPIGESLEQPEHRSSGSGWVAGGVVGLIVGFFVGRR